MRPTFRAVRYLVVITLKFSAIAILLSAGIFLGGCATSSKTMKLPPLKTVPYVDLNRYMGDWRVIANVPYCAEKDCVDSIETYRLRPDGKITNLFTFRKKSLDAPQEQIQALARVYNRDTNAEWRITFFYLITAKYFITDLDPDYQWAVVAHPSRKYGWIMAREKSLPDATYAGILKRLEEQGYQASQFQKVPQSPDKP